MSAVLVRCPDCLTGYRIVSPAPGKIRTCKKCGLAFPAEALAAPERACGADGIPLDWEPGDVILDIYEVRPLAARTPYAEGGMGRVNRVWHRQWRTELAVKSVHSGRLRSPQAVEDFKAEAEEWVRKIGLHPHVVSCFYVRVLGGSPRVFIEYVDGGSLKEWIDTGRLYEGGPEAALARILDVAIQIAWGLHHVHEPGLIHQDVKPQNVMMTASGEAKVTDLGLAGARARSLGESGTPPAGQTLLATWGGMTPAYCSPEQAGIQASKASGAGKEQWPRLTRRTDVWSWAVSVLEKFLGKVAWPSGSVAHVGLARDADDPHIPKMPAEVRALLERCLRRRAEDRPHDLMQVADSLQEIQQQVGLATPRVKPQPAGARAETLNNRALSLMDLGKKEETLQLWNEALRMESQHPQAALQGWSGGARAGLMTMRWMRRCAGRTRKPGSASALLRGTVRSSGRRP